MAADCVVNMLFCAWQCSNLPDWQYLVGLQMVTTCKLDKCASSPTSVLQIKYASLPCTASQVNRGAVLEQLQSFCRTTDSADYVALCCTSMLWSCTVPQADLQAIGCTIPSVYPPRQPTCCQFPYLQRSACVTITWVYLRDSRKRKIMLHPPYVPLGGCNHKDRNCRC